MFGVAEPKRGPSIERTARLLITSGPKAERLDGLELTGDAQLTALGCLAYASGYDAIAYASLIGMARHFGCETYTDDAEHKEATGKLTDARIVAMKKLH